MFGKGRSINIISSCTRRSIQEVILEAISKQDTVATWPISSGSRVVPKPKGRQKADHRVCECVSECAL